MEKIIPNGTEVLIFKYVREWGPNQDDENYVVGIVQSSKTSDDLSIHGSSHYVQIYEVLGNDGNRYTGTYGNGLIGNSFFRTKGDQVEILKRKISHNKETITKLQEKNNEYIKQISSLIEKGMDSQKFDVLAVPCSRAFVVKPEKWEEFKDLKPDFEIRKQMEEIVKKFKVNNLDSVEDHKILIKIKK